MLVWFIAPRTAATVAATAAMTRSTWLTVSGGVRRFVGVVIGEHGSTKASIRDSERAGIVVEIGFRGKADVNVLRVRVAACVGSPPVADARIPDATVGDDVLNASVCVRSERFCEVKGTMTVSEVSCEVPGRYNAKSVRIVVAVPVSVCGVAYDPVADSASAWPRRVHLPFESFDCSCWSPVHTWPRYHRSMAKSLSWCDGSRSSFAGRLRQWLRLEILRR